MLKYTSTTSSRELEPRFLFSDLSTCSMLSYFIYSKCFKYWSAQIQVTIEVLQLETTTRLENAAFGLRVLHNCSKIVYAKWSKYWHENWNAVWASFKQSVQLLHNYFLIYSNYFKYWSTQVKVLTEVWHTASGRGSRTPYLGYVRYAIAPKLVTTLTPNIEVHINNFCTRTGTLFGFHFSDLCISRN